MCLVQPLDGTPTSGAQTTWESFGFTGTVIFLDTLTNPPWKIGWQSLDPGVEAPCTSGVSVAQAPPTPAP